MGGTLKLNTVGQCTAAIKDERLRGLIIISLVESTQ